VGHVIVNVHFEAFYQSRECAASIITFYLRKVSETRKRTSHSRKEEAGKTPRPITACLPKVAIKVSY